MLRWCDFLRWAASSTNYRDATQRAPGHGLCLCGPGRRLPVRPVGPNDYAYIYVAYDEPGHVAGLRRAAPIGREGSVRGRALQRKRLRAGASDALNELSRRGTRARTKHGVMRSWAGRRALRRRPLQTAVEGPRVPTSHSSSDPTPSEPATRGLCPASRSACTILLRPPISDYAPPVSPFITPPKFWARSSAVRRLGGKAPRSWRAGVRHQPTANAATAAQSLDGELPSSLRHPATVEPTPLWP